MGTWQLQRSANGSVTPFAFDQPIWARFVRFTSNSFKGYSYPEVPDQLRVIEQATDDQYRSVVAEWGDANQNGIHEALDPPALTVPQTGPDGNDTQATATPLAAGTPVQDTAHAGQDVDWYSVQVPGTQNTLAFTVGGTPFVGVSLALFDANGGQVPMTYSPGDAGTAQYRATVTPGASYAVEVTQPPFSAALTYDTSGSMGPYLGFVQEALTSFAGGVVKGRERVTMIPFEEQPLIQGWSDDPYVLADAVEGQVLGSSSSSAETSLINATDALSTQEGAKAILIVTDAETSSFDQMTALWRKLAAVRPVIFAVHVAGNGSPATDQHFMQDWAASTDGFYQYAQTHAEIDRAFDRMATWLARPAGYTLSYGASFVKPPSGGGPAGSLAVVAPQSTNGNPTVRAGAGVAVEVILDTSGSMLTPISGRTRRIDAAKSVLDDLLKGGLPQGAPVALRILGNAAQPCGTDLVVPLGPLDPPRMVRLVDGINVVQAADTPIAAAIAAVPGDLKSASGSKTLILITDSQEVWPNRTCAARIRWSLSVRWSSTGIAASVNIVGLAISDPKARQNLARLASAGHGAFYSANDTGELAAAVAQALQAPFQVFDASGKLVASGVVGGPPVPIKPGTYRVAVQTDPEIDFDPVVVQPGKPLVLTLTPAADSSNPAPSTSP